jgi:hypothetical protein
VDVGLDHCGIHSHLAALHDFVLHRQRYNPLMNLFDCLRTQSPRLAAQRFSVGHYARGHARELPV